MGRHIRSGFEPGLIRKHRPSSNIITTLKLETASTAIRFFHLSRSERTALQYCWLNLYQPETDLFTHYVGKDGLPNGFIYGILEDDLAGFG
ncbi:MAG: hypothetical protein U0V48_00100 [Anaerolineales bacterium]